MTCPELRRNRHQQDVKEEMQALAGVVELVDAGDLKSSGAQAPCGFKSRPRH